jgi:hypothetical protein
MPCFALASSGNDGSVSIDAGCTLRNSGPLPDACSHVVDGVHQSPHRVLIEAPKIVAGGGWIGNGSGAQRIKERPVVAAYLRRHRAD